MNNLAGFQLHPTNIKVQNLHNIINLNSHLEAKNKFYNTNSIFFQICPNIKFRHFVFDVGSLTTNYQTMSRYSKNNILRKIHLKILKEVLNQKILLSHFECKFL